MIVPIEITIKIRSFTYKYNLNLEMKEEGKEILDVEVHPDLVNKGDDDEDSKN